MQINKIMIVWSIVECHIKRNLNFVRKSKKIQFEELQLFKDCNLNHSKGNFDRLRDLGAGWVGWAIAYPLLLVAPY